MLAASEVVGFAKTGGLADVTGALTPALTGLGEKVAAIIPCYRGIENRFKAVPTGLKVRIPLLQGEELVEQTGEILESRLPGGASVFLVKHDGFFNREALYGNPDGDYSDNCARFTFFCRAVLEFLRLSKWKPDVIHCHDWQTALIPIYLKTTMRDDPALKGIKTALTIHNLGYQGKFWHWDMKVIGLPWEYFTLDYLEYFGNINLLKGGIVLADTLTTVSPGYAREIQTEEHGAGLTGPIRARAADLHGILNGIDYGIWNPATDRHLPATYGPDNLTGKARCKAALQKELGLLAAPEVPVIGMISRLADQKGFDILAEAFESIMATKAQFVLLGAGERKYHDLFTGLAKKHPGQAGVRIGFDDGLAHRIEAGSDIFLMPSLYEPCGLNQMISLKYGTVPVVRATGGLDDTVKPWAARGGKGNGFKFEPYTPEALVLAIGAALAAYKKPKEWPKLMANGMAEDHSWSVAAAEYQALFREMLGLKKPAAAQKTAAAKATVSGAARKAEPKAAPAPRAAARKPAPRKSAPRKAVKEE